MLVVVQARMGSVRCPGKVLRVAGGRPVIGHLLDRLKACRRVSGVVVAIPAEVQDDPLAGWLRGEGVKFYRGPEDDVALRFIKATRGYEAFVRVCADSPEIDPGTVDRGIGLFRGGEWDLVTNAPNPGNAVEVIRRAALISVYPDMTPSQREHVTPGLYGRPRVIHWRSAKQGTLIDTEADWASYAAAWRGSERRGLRA